MSDSPDELFLSVYINRSELHKENGRVDIFLEGKPRKETQERYQRIRAALESGFLEEKILKCKEMTTDIEEIPLEKERLLETLIDSLTSEVGRALVAITIMQLCIKCIVPEQSIRLHKGGHGAFSWEEGVSMRSLDKCYITPALREHGLLRLNADGFMMTRSLAENYPYTKLYKAAMRGARDEWLGVVDFLEGGELKPESALIYMISRLFNRSEAFTENVESTMEIIGRIVAERSSPDKLFTFIKDYVDNSAYSARVFEIALHSLFQVLEANGVFVGELERLSQMRSANKKHGNIGDVEIVEKRGSRQIIEAWDAKYGKPYLRDELEELKEKLSDHPETQIAGFVVDAELDLREDIEERRMEIEDICGVEICLCSFREWVANQFERIGGDDQAIATAWLQAFAESICQRRREIAPIDEPSDVWVSELKKQAKQHLA